MKRAGEAVSLPQPVPGLVIRYAYLWEDEYRRGQEEGLKDRPCAVILVTADEDGDRIVTVLPVTHSPPANPALAVEIPPATKRRLGLDDERSWIVLTEANRFAWPGPDLRLAQAGDLASVAYGELPGVVLREIKTKLAQALTARLVRVVPRTE
jgi:hypothetical protein